MKTTMQGRRRVARLGEFPRGKKGVGRVETGRVVVGMAMMVVMLIMYRESR